MILKKKKKKNIKYLYDFKIKVGRKEMTSTSHLIIGTAQRLNAPYVLGPVLIIVYQ